MNIRHSSGYWDQVVSRWEGADHLGLWRRYHDMINRMLLQRWIPGGKTDRVLKTDLFDEAVGSGLFQKLKSDAREVVGIDISRAIAETAGDRYPDLRTVVADVRDLPFREASFDLIVSNSTLDHFESEGDIPVALKELRRVLSPEGTLVATLDNAANPAVWFRNALPQKMLQRLGITQYHVGATCGPGRFRQHLIQAGLHPAEMTSIQHCPRAPAVALLRWMGHRRSTWSPDSWLRFFETFERLEHWPTRYQTGYYLAVRATR